MILRKVNGFVRFEARRVGAHTSPPPKANDTLIEEIIEKVEKSRKL
jgi:hypothetical protein